MASNSDTTAGTGASYYESFFSKEQQKLIEDAIVASELQTSGEIRVHIERVCTAHTVYDRAVNIFAELNMHKTEERNGVLIYFAMDDHKFAIIGDAGIHAKVPVDFWDTIKIKMQTKFRAGLFTEGIIEAIQMAGQQLHQFFPYQKNDLNELSNKISFGQA